MIHEAEKQRIATAAAESLGTASTVFLDEGDTALLVAEAICNHPRQLTVVTGSLATALALAPSGHVTMLLGGRVRQHPGGASDHWATDMLGKLNIDVAMVGAHSISARRGLGTSDEGVAAVKRTAVRMSARRIFIGTAAKFEAKSLYTFATVSDLDLIITDSTLPTREVDQFANLGPRVMRV